MKDYQKLDKEILRFIFLGKKKFFGLESQPRINSECQILALIKNAPPFRILDRRLQALRKAGKIEYKNLTWHIANTSINIEEKIYQKAKL